MGGEGDKKVQFAITYARFAKGGMGDNEAQSGEEN